MCVDRIDTNGMTAEQLRVANEVLDPSQALWSGAHRHDDWPYPWAVVVGLVLVCVLCGGSLIFAVIAMWR